MEIFQAWFQIVLQEQRRGELGSKYFPSQIFQGNWSLLKLDVEAPGRRTVVLRFKEGSNIGDCWHGKSFIQQQTLVNGFWCLPFTGTYQAKYMQICPVLTNSTIVPSTHSWLSWNTLRWILSVKSSGDIMLKLRHGISHHGHQWRIKGRAARANCPLTAL